MRENGVSSGEGYAVANLADLGEGPGFRKIRGALGVTAFGVNAIVLPPSYSTGSHYPDEQEELFRRLSEIEGAPPAEGDRNRSGFWSRVKEAFSA